MPLSVCPRLPFLLTSQLSSRPCGRCGLTILGLQIPMQDLTPSRTPFFPCTAQPRSQSPVLLGRPLARPVTVIEREGDLEEDVPDLVFVHGRLAPLGFADKGAEVA